jgi:hypothetical protein
LGRRRLRDHSSPPKNQLWVADGYITILPRQKINLFFVDGYVTTLSRQKTQTRVADGYSTILFSLPIFPLPLDPIFSSCAHNFENSSGSHG